VSAPGDDGGRPPAGPAPIASLDLVRIVLAAADDSARRHLQEAITEQLAAHWRRRADALLAARPQPGDYVGNATREEIRAQWYRLTEAARACLARAELCPLEDIAADVADVLGESA
jgi:hypothetical protein